MLPTIPYKVVQVLERILLKALLWVYLRLVDGYPELPSCFFIVFNSYKTFLTLKLNYIYFPVQIKVALLKMIKKVSFYNMACNNHTNSFT